MEFGSGIFATKQSKAIIATNEEQSVGTVDWPSMLCTLNVTYVTGKVGIIFTT